MILVIDNYDSPNYKTELSEGSRVCEELRGTGCYILITSRNSLNPEICYGSDQTVLTPLDTKDLVKLFKKHAGFNNNDYKKDKKIRSFIKDYLKSNTYLVILAARLVSTSSLEEVLNSIFIEHNIKENDEPIEGRGTNDKTIFEHLTELFNISDVFNSEEKRSIFYNMSLLKIAGAGYKVFFERAFDKSIRGEYKKHFKELVKNFWVFSNNKTATTVITMQPLVRELILCKKEDFKYDYVRKYVEYLNDHSFFRTYDEKIAGVIEDNTAALEMLEILTTKEDKKKETDYACLMAKTASNFDIIKDVENAYKYGTEAVSILNEIDYKALNDAQLYDVALSYNIAGYAILHHYNKKGSDDEALNALEKVKIILGKMSKEKCDQLDVKILDTTNKGDIAAVSMAKKDYNKMLKIHEDNKRFREKLLNEYKDKGTEEEIILLCIKIADSCKGIGTAYYHIAGKHFKKGNYADSKECFEKSVRFQNEAVVNYTMAYGDNYHFQIAISQNRKVGALLKQYECFPEDMEKEKIKLALKEMKEAEKYLSNMSMKNGKEYKDCIDRIKKLALLQEEIKEKEKQL